MKGADIGLGWVDQSGQVHLQVCIIFSSILSINIILYIYRIDIHITILDQ